MKKKILFYGNCQLGGVSNCFSALPNFHEHYEVLLPEDYNLPHHPGFDYSVAVHLIKRVHQNPEELCDEEMLNARHASVLNAVNDSDIVIFQTLDSSRFGHQFCSDELLAEHKGQSVSVPSFYFTSYMGMNLKYPMLDLFVWLRRQGKQYQDVYEFIVNENHPIMARLIQYYYQFCMDGLKSRREKDSLKHDYIDIAPWIERNYNDTFLCYTINHPTKYYYAYIVNELIRVLGMSSIDPVHEVNTYIAGTCGHFYPMAFKSFRENYPSITEEHMQSFKPLYDTHKHYTSDQLDRFIELGIARAESYLSNSVELPERLEKALKVIDLNE